MKNFLELGNYNALCDSCGRKFKANQLKRRWDGLMVCEEDYELRHPQDFLRVQKEQIAVPWARPYPEEDTFIQVCDLWDRQDRADFGSADCSQVGYITDINILIDVFRATSVAGIAIAGRSIAGVEF